MEKKNQAITVRLTEEQRQYLAEVAEHQTLPTDGAPNLSRAVQSMVMFLMTSFGLQWIGAQRKQRMTLYPGGEAATA